MQDQLDAAATVIAALHAENITLRRQTADTRARIVPLACTAIGDGRRR
ncbi:hypothetical protein [Actinoplanes xinjiangensis]